MIDPNFNSNDSTGPRKSRFWALRHAARDADVWYRPLGTLGERAPHVLAEHDQPRVAVDLGYERRPYDSELFLPVYAPRSGIVTSCEERSTGFALELDHLGHEWITSFAHLSKVFVPTDLQRRRGHRPCIRGGDVLGYAAKSPAYVRFALVKKCADGRRVAVAPMPQLAAWSEPPSTLNRKAA